MVTLVVRLQDGEQLWARLAERRAVEDLATHIRRARGGGEDRILLLRDEEGVVTGSFRALEVDDLLLLN